MDNSSGFISLTGKLLIATQNSTDSMFGHSIVLITHHTQTDGAVGYILNKPLQSLSPAEVFKDRPFDFLGPDFCVKRGGPMDLGHGAVLHSAEYQALDTQPLFDNVALTETQQILDDISDQIGPKYFMILIGKAAWAPAQLEDEIMANMWIQTDPSFDLIFKTPDNKKWQESLATLKIDAKYLAFNAGKA